MAEDFELLRDAFATLPFIAKMLSAIVTGMLIGGVIVALVRGGRSLRDRLRDGRNH